MCVYVCVLLLACDGHGLHVAEQHEWDGLVHDGAEVQPEVVDLGRHLHTDTRYSHTESQDEGRALARASLSRSCVW